MQLGAVGDMLGQSVAIAQIAKVTDIGCIVLPLSHWPAMSASQSELAMQSVAFDSSIGPSTICKPRRRSGTTLSGNAAVLSRQIPLCGTAGSHAPPGLKATLRFLFPR
jgi:hypothetical protein